MLSCWQNVRWKQPLPGSISSNHIVTGLCLTTLNRCSVDDSGAIMWMEYAGLSTHPGQTVPNVSLERQVAPQSVLLSWGSRNGQNVSCWLSHRCLGYMLTQCVSACVILLGGRRFNFTCENYENLHYSITLMQDTELALLPRFGKHSFSHFNVPVIPTCFLV